MKSLDAAHVEAERLHCLQEYGVLDTPPEAAFDRITALAARLLDMPIALVSLVDADRIWFKSRQGIDATEMPGTEGFCPLTIQGAEPLIVNDTWCDPRTVDHPAVTGALGWRFYAGIPLRTRTGYNLGTLCVIDRRPRDLTLADRAILEDLAALVMAHLELRLDARRALQAKLAMREKLWEADAGKKVAESETRRFFALAAAQVGDWELDLLTGETKHSILNDRCFGYERPIENWDYAIFLEHVHPDDRDEVDRRFQQARDEGTLFEVEFRVLWPDGSLHWVLSRGAFYHDVHGQPVSAAGIQLDITERKRAQSEIDRLAMVVRKITMPVLITDLLGRIEWINDAFSQMTGYEVQEVKGRTPGSFLQGPETSPLTIQVMRNAIRKHCGFEVDVLNYHKNGTPLWQHIKADPIPGTLGQPAGYISVQADITQRKSLESQLWAKANRDGLTGLPNRRLFWDRLNQEVRHGRRSNNAVALLFIDLDRFKEINDLHGHEAGDNVLREVASRINACVRECDTAARIGGDEFAVILSDLAVSLQVEIVARKLLSALAAPISLNSHVSSLSASIGVALFPTDAGNAGQLLNYADQAMYLAKTSGGNRFTYFTPLMQQRSERRLQLGQDLRQAMANHQFEVYFQPIVSLATGRIVKAEALLRWNHPTKGPVGPAEFIPLAEELGLIEGIGQWVFQEAAMRAAEWSSIGVGPVQVSVNKSAMQFVSQSGTESWPRQLQRLNIPCSQLSVEITEGVLLKDSKAVMQTLAEYRDAGLEVALDDFGTGYSAMAYLNKFSIDYLKIDQSFISDIDSASSRAIAEAIIAMGHKLGIQIIAEGIETEEQKQILIEAGCDFGQGYLFSRAVPHSDFRKLLRNDALH
ncbi:MAG: EAL domain-containing protein [Herminiimonas sp.]|nr:EAL domain-containing protein [Herminiimonas sp.]